MINALKNPRSGVIVALKPMFSQSFAFSRPDPEDAEIHRLQDTAQSKGGGGLGIGETC